MIKPALARRRRFGIALDRRCAELSRWLEAFVWLLYSAARQVAAETDARAAPTTAAAATGEHSCERPARHSLAHSGTMDGRAKVVSIGVCSSVGFFVGVVDR
jgi:hypothetical protein